MSTSIDHALPPKFSALMHFVPHWALPTRYDRREKRACASMTDLTDFHDALSPHMRDIALYLDGLSTDAPLATPDENLLRLAYMYAEVAMAVEVYSEPEHPAPMNFPRERVEIIL